MKWSATFDKDFQYLTGADDSGNILVKIQISKQLEKTLISIVFSIVKSMINRLTK